MFEDAQQNLERILALVKQCPANLQEKCFELLLSKYLATYPTSGTPKNNTGGSGTNPTGNNQTDAATSVPEAIRNRFNAIVSRTKASMDKAVSLFDFNTDPFTYHAISIPGTSKREQMRNVALMLALRGYLTGTNWSADWKEFRANCLDHNCWDQNNVVNTMKHDWFKSASSAEGITLSQAGIKASEILFATLTGATPDAS